MLICYIAGTGVRRRPVLRVLRGVEDVILRVGVDVHLEAGSTPRGKGAAVGSETSRGGFVAGVRDRPADTVGWHVA